MIGKQQIEYNAKDFIRGMTTNDNTSDGGFAASSANINPLVSPGAIYATAPAGTIDSGGKPAGNLIASCPDINVTPKSRIFVTDKGEFYYVNSFIATGLANLINASDTTKYAAAITDLVAFNSAFYTTRTTNIAKLTWDHSSASLNETWWTATALEADGMTHPAALVTNPHPMLVFQKRCWIADGNFLHYFDTSEVVSYDVLTFAPTEVITALGIDPATGYMLIATVLGQDASGLAPQQFFVYLYDGSSPLPVRKIPVEDLVTGFQSVGGRVYVAMGKTLGLWNGVGVQFLRTLNILLDSASLAYKQHMTAYNNTLLVIEKDKVLAYGAITQKSEPVFFYIHQNSNANSSGLTHLASVGQGQIFIAYNDSVNNRAALFDITSKTAGAGNLYLPNIYFPRPVFISKVRVFTTGITAGSSGGTVGLIDEVGVTNRVTNFTLANASAYKQASSTNYVFDFNYANLKLQTMQPLIALSTSSYGIVRVIIYYDTAE